MRVWRPSRWEPSKRHLTPLRSHADLTREQRKPFAALDRQELLLRNAGLSQEVDCLAVSDYNGARSNGETVGTRQAIFMGSFSNGYPRNLVLYCVLLVEVGVRYEYIVGLRYFVSTQVLGQD